MHQTENPRHDLTREETYTHSLTSPTESFWPRRSNRVSSRTASAILWVLEDALRQPHPFTPDLDEENASMSALMPGVAGMGQPQHQNGTHMRAAQSGSNLAAAQSIPAGGVRTPRDVLRQREARKREQEQQQQQQQRKQQEQQAQQAQYAGVAGEPRRPGGSASRPPDMPLPQDPAVKGHARGGSVAQPAQAPRLQTQPARQRTQQPAQPEAPTQAEQPQPKRPSFPHAFERWEMLSSHWEGLTGYWIRRLEQTKEEISRDPINQQLSRQVTDLSAAGANLFHAVVELQRLRASSERKFQRWFFDTRAEQERNQELRAELERRLKAEQQARTEAVAASKQAEADKLKAEELVREMRRELQISKEEARRAWEELGRREQEERERTAALRNGEPTIVGGVQVVPTIPPIPSRQTTSANRPSTREGPYAGGPGPMRMGGQDPASEEQYEYEDEAMTPTRADHSFADTTPGKEPVSSAQPMPAQQAGKSRFYQHADHPALNPDSATNTAPAPSSSPEYTPGRTARTAYPPSISEDSDDYADEHDEYGRRHHPHPYGQVQYSGEEEEPVSVPVHSGYSAGVDYSGSGWGPWDSVTPRHRHPTRLSDVLEEDERSRTSASRASQASRTVQ